MINFLVLVLIVFNVYLYLELRKEKKRIRVLTVFIDALTRFSFKVPSMIIETIKKEEPKYINDYDGLGNKIIFDQLKKSFESDFWINPYLEFIKKERDLFVDNKYYNGGFNDLYSALFSELSKNVEVDKKN